RDITKQKQAEEEQLRLSMIEKELSIAQTMQQSLLPEAKPTWPDIDIVCYNQPAKEVGGDFYSYYRFDEGAKPTGQPRKYGISVGDVSGKGVSAALLMATSLSQFDASLSIDLSPATRMAHLDQALLPYTQPRRQNCAMCYVEILPPTSKNSIGHLNGVNAGCIPPYIRRTNGQVIEMNIGGFALGQGLGAQEGYQEADMTLEPGDFIILTSDGIVEATNKATEIFGFERLQQAIATGPTDTAKAMLKHLLLTVETFIQGTEPNDDLTIVIVKV
ncbi:MAG: PP2C family protein-serine/threonine phosphatase, partial [Chloroflexota bacterium]